MSTPPHGKYQLRTLHEEIGLFDRKLAHLLKYESFPSEAEREAAAGKLNSKRNLLVKSALQMAKDGVEFSPSEVPSSLRPVEEQSTDPVPSSAEPSSELQQLVPAGKTQDAQAQPSPYAGTSLDCRLEVQAYKRTKAKKQA
jgi:hypothetical protein